MSEFDKVFYIVHDQKKTKREISLFQLTKLKSTKEFTNFLNEFKKLLKYDIEINDIAVVGKVRIEKWRDISIFSNSLHCQISTKEVRLQ